jgi:hypothetical protein
MGLKYDMNTSVFGLRVVVVLAVVVLAVVVVVVVVAVVVVPVVDVTHHPAVLVDSDVVHHGEVSVVVNTVDSAAV